MSRFDLDRELDRELARKLTLAPLDDRFDAAILARIDTLPQDMPLHAPRAARLESETLQQHLAREERQVRFVVGAYGLAAAVVLSAVAEIASHLMIPALSLPALSLPALSLPVASLPPVNVLAVPIAAVAVLGAGAWMFARDRVYSILSI